MKQGGFSGVVSIFALALITSTALLGQSSSKKILFAVLEDGKRIEPIGFVQSGMFVASGEGKDPGMGGEVTPYLAAGKSYTLIFGGSADGTTKVTKQITGECAGKSAEVTSTKTNLKGFVMAVASDGSFTLKTPAVRRLPTDQERAAVEKLVRDELTKQKVPSDALKTLNYLNLTAIDFERNGNSDLVGSYWVAPKDTERALLYVVVEMDSSKNYKLTYSEFDDYTQEEVMSGNIKDVDSGVYHNLLLDYVDINGDGIGEILNTAQAFEGRNFSVLKREGGIWNRIHESYNYRCGF
jgi:hypothetical protein